MYLVLFACLTAGLAAAIQDPTWEEYKLKYGKAYAPDEDRTRYDTWKRTHAEIDTHNAEYSRSYDRGENQFTDMTNEEYRETMLGFRLPEEILDGSVTSQGAKFVPLASGVSLPVSIDWNEKGYVTPVKNQGQCGSCYSFAATGALEAAWAKKTMKLFSLSEQQIVDCSGKYGNFGCGGGWYQAAWKYIRDVGGITTERGYPYEHVQAACRFNHRYIAAHVKSFVDLPSGDENAMKQAVGTAGPVAVAIDARHPSFQSYKSGVYYERACGKTLRDLDHAVLVVGYGTESGRDYWLVKNSWGSWFGLSGYIKMARNYSNQCGIVTRSAYPLV